MAFHKARALQEAEKSVAQGKIAQAIRQYQDILDNDPADVTLLNTIGDLYIRDRNITEGLRQFHKLAEAYVREGFNVKAIAIYRKISKVDPNSVDTLLKLAELYQLQGLSREAREQYLQATEFFKKRNQAERALEVIRKLVLLDPENLNFRNRLAAECEQAGKREEAAHAHMESAEILLRRDDQAGAEASLKKAAELDPKNSKIQFLRARVAIARHEPEEAENIINSLPELLADPAGKRVLLDAYLGARKAPEAERLVREVFSATPSDFVPISSVSALLVDKGNIDDACQLLASVAEQMINQNNAPALLEALRRIWTKAPKHIPTMELVHRVCERTADEVTLAEVLEALGRAHEEAGDLEKAEEAYLKLVEREPDDENYRGFLNAVQKKLGRTIKPVDFASREMALTEEDELPPVPAEVDAVQDAMVKEALENSDLFARYHLDDKAISELDKVLQVYPDQIDVHRRILEISRKSFPERAAMAAAHLARIFTALGDADVAGKYQAIATAKGPLHELPLPPTLVKKGEAPVAPPPAPEKPEAEMTMQFAAPVLLPEPPAPVAPPPPQEVAFDLTPPEAPSEPPPPPPRLRPISPDQTLELDLSGDLESMAAFGFEAPAPAEPEPVAPPPAAPPPVEIPLPIETLAPIEEPPPIQEPPPPPPVVEEAAPPIEAPPIEAPPVEPPPVEAFPVEAPAFEAPIEAPAEAPVEASAEIPIEVPEPPPPAVEAEAEEEEIPVDLEDSRIEVEFYLENGFVEEARQSVAALEEKYPGSAFVVDLRRRLDERAAEAAPAEPPVVPAAPLDEPVVPAPPAPAASLDEPVVPEPPAEFDLAIPEAPVEAPAEDVHREPVVAPPPEPLLEEEEEAIPEEWELPTSFASATPAPPATEMDPVVPPPSFVAAPQTEPVVEMDPVLPPPVAEPEPPAPPPVERVAPPPAPAPVPAPVVEEPIVAGGGGMDMLGDLAGDFASTLDGLAVPEAPATTPVPPPMAAGTPKGGSPQGAAQLSGLLAEMEEPGGAAAQAARDDPETHYNLGVAFREMGLLDEAIGEFQKLVKGAGKGIYPSNFLQACSLLAICFMDKKMPAIAVKWYLRALETPNLDEEALMALQYDLGLAYEQAGDSRNALERFTEVYSQNIDFRDVAEKIRELQQKA